jgi:hypothetical protein
MIFRNTWVLKIYYEYFTIMPEIQIPQCGSKECGNSAHLENVEFHGVDCSFLFVLCAS